ncbi:MAG: AAA family ATPase [Promethearchaeota archaeon]
MFVAISGYHGSGKSTTARLVAQALGFSYHSTGKIFRQMAQERDMSLVEFNQFAGTHPEVDRQLDDRVVDLARGGNCVLEGQLVSFLTKDLPDGLRVFLWCPEEVRVERMRERDSESDVCSILEETKKRAESERKRFIELYGVDLGDFSSILEANHLVVDTSRFNVDDTVAIVLAAARLAGNKV